MAQGKAEDAGGLTPVKDDNVAMHHLNPRTFVRNYAGCSNRKQKEELPCKRTSVSNQPSASRCGPWP